MSSNIEMSNTGTTVKIGEIAATGVGMAAGAGVGGAIGVTSVAAAAQAAAAATSAVVPVIGWVVGGAIVLGAGSWGVYKWATS